MLILGAVAGCPGDEPPATSGEPGALQRAQGSRRSRSSRRRTSRAAAKDAAPKDMQPAAKPGDTTKKPDESPKLEAPKADAKGDTAAVQLKPDEIAEIKKLPAAEQDQALKQAVCPVSGHHLGSMEKPIKVTAEGRTFFLCCEGCEPDLKKDPKAVIAKLDQEVSRRAFAARAGDLGAPRRPHPFRQAGVWRRADACDILPSPAKFLPAWTPGADRVSPALMRSDRAPPPKS